ncbi:MAG: hypothetical protein FJZ56_05255 [Chlamydiae bacterium]|nr:hypothetical protein [Chlamydiota bacterium]
MNKNIKLLLGIALLGTGAYMLFIQKKQKKSYSGEVGRRMRMTGHKMNASGLKGLKIKRQDRRSFVPDQLPVYDSGWQGADGGFKATKDEKVFKDYAGGSVFNSGDTKIFSADGTGNFFKPKDSGFQG